ncbi:glycosyltransferase family 2 protein [Thalassococcus sp. BH17M4-6]|uniref:glycosyltransferase family 2 protein n=1 Tax=Thalassococcus sp. BH17M4-6 TaxID=3413148 RepID=UPI003BE269CC
MEGLAVSVVVVSRDRPAALTRCLTGLSQLDHPRFEVIVVACPHGIAAVQGRADAELIKQVPFDEANISAARNLGIAQAAGDIVAFIDDDAVPEPLWLRHLTEPFANPLVAAAGGYVRGRNGIGFQWRARTVDATGAAQALPVENDAPLIRPADPEAATKTEGTNMAVRRAVLADMGGFDPAFRFYLDETDLNMRLALAGRATAIVPLAQVHHGYAPSARRAADRTPRDLSEIGASLAVYLRKHAHEDAGHDAWGRMQAEQHTRLLRLMQRGPLGPDDVMRLMRGLRRGWADGMDRPLTPLPQIAGAATAFLAYPGRPGARHTILSGRSWQRRTLEERAAKAVAEGDTVTLFRFSPTAIYHRMEFRAEGYWQQTGGQFGRSDRDGPLFRLTTLRRRVAQERARIAMFRGN